MVNVEKEPNDFSLPEEQCVFCRGVTAYWYRKADIACCQGCAAHANDEDFPTKEQWVRRERIAHWMKYAIDY